MVVVEFVVDGIVELIGKWFCVLFADGFELVVHHVMREESGDLVVTEMGTVQVPVDLVVTLVTRVELLLITGLALG